MANKLKIPLLQSDNNHIAIPETSLEQLQGKLPELLLSFLKEEGEGSYGNKLFIISDPIKFSNEHADSIKRIIEYTFSYEPGIIWGYTAFGTLFMCLDGQIMAYSINYATTYSNSDDDEEGLIEFFNRTMANLLEEEIELYKVMKTQLGALAENEIYGFKKPLLNSEEPIVENAYKVKLIDYLPQLLDQTT
ncbi:MAG: GAD-like domain-containing protein [Bacteroidota bacterium]